MAEHLAKPADGYLIMKRGLYYRPNAMGYTGIREKAGRYSLSDAQAHADPESGVTFLHESEAPELAPQCLDEVANPYLLEELDAARARCGDLLAACQSVIPHNLCTDNPNVSDDQVIPLDFTMGELRRIAAAIAKATSSEPRSA